MLDSINTCLVKYKQAVQNRPYQDKQTRFNNCNMLVALKLMLQQDLLKALSRRLWRERFRGVIVVLGSLCAVCGFGFARRLG